MELELELELELEMDRARELAALAETGFGGETAQRDAEVKLLYRR